MSLQVWLPLHKTLANQGVSGVSVSLQNGTATYSDTGKLGSCLYNGANGSNIIIPYNFHSVNRLSICFWVKADSPNAWMDLFSIGQYANRMETNTTTGDMYYWFCDDNSYAIASSSSSLFSIPNAVWTHISVTFDGSYVRFYKNGILSQTLAQLRSISSCIGNNPNIFIGRRRPSESAYYKGYFEDIRIYNHCLSAKEVKEISKGLVLHYKLDDITSTLSANKYGGDYFAGSSSSSSYTKTKLANEAGYNYTLSRTGTGSSTWPSLAFPTVSFTAGKTYDYSLKCRCNSANFSINFRAAHIPNDWVTSSVTVVSSALADKKWHEYHIKIQVNSTWNRSGTDYACTPLIELYSQDQATSGQNYSCNFDLKDIQICECNFNAPTNSGSWAGTRVVDVSGNRYNGTRSGNVSLALDSPRYSYCSEFGSNGYINVGQANGKMPTDRITVSAWAYLPNWNISTPMRMISCTEGGGFQISINETGSGSVWVYLYRAGVGYQTLQYALSKLSAGWHHFAFTFSGTELILYVDSVVGASASLSNTGIGYNSTAPLLISGEPNSSAYTGASWQGKISDVRVYATALSADDIKQLYQTSASIDKQGNLFCGEVVEQ